MERHEPRNPTLHGLLEKGFGDVRVHHPGDPGSRLPLMDPVTVRPYSRLFGGEQYVIPCPWCPDNSKSLYLSYRYGQWDEATQTDGTHLVYCYRGDCLAEPGRLQQLKDRIFDGSGDAPEPPAARGRRRTFGCDFSFHAPGLLRRLTRFSLFDPVGLHLARLPYRRDELEYTWHVAWLTPFSLSPAPAGGLFVPVFLNGVVADWQVLPPREPDRQAAGVPTSIDSTSLKSGNFIYNFEAARRQPLAVVVEEVTDAWQVGPSAVALFGKTANDTQVRLLADCWYNKPVVILLGADAADQAEGLRRRLEPLHQGGVVVARLPDGLAAADCPRDLLWDLLYAEAAEQGVALPPAEDMPPATLSPYPECMRVD
jgi:hypothetical protein